MNHSCYLEKMICPWSFDTCHIKSAVSTSPCMPFFLQWNTWKLFTAPSPTPLHFSCYQGCHLGEGQSSASDSEGKAVGREAQVESESHEEAESCQRVPPTTGQTPRPLCLPTMPAPVQLLSYFRKSTLWGIILLTFSFTSSSQCFFHPRGLSSLIFWN